MNSVEHGIARYVGEATLARLQGVRIGIAGAGGLGSNCAACLVRCGFRRFTIADADAVEPSNLNRQFFFAHQVAMPKVAALAENMAAINPDVEVELVEERIGRANARLYFGDCDAVVEAFDTPEDKAMLAQELLPHVELLVTVSGMAGYGNTDAIVCRTLRANCIVVGDGLSDTDAGAQPFAPGAAIASAKQADAVFAHFMRRFAA
ncbi:MAG: sulfur carrier protein ThiS adenylyltransferase ThiF [Desulfovibrionaceae bacterium]